MRLTKTKVDIGNGSTIFVKVFDCFCFFFEIGIIIVVVVVVVSNMCPIYCWWCCFFLTHFFHSRWLQHERDDHDNDNNNCYHCYFN